MIDRVDKGLVFKPLNNRTAQPPSSRTHSTGDGDRRRPAKPLEHTAGSPSAALVQQLSVGFLTWTCSRGLGRRLLQIPHSERVTGYSSRVV
jgi:hypothetical protein